MSRLSPLTLVALALLIGGCDRQGSAPAQPTAAAAGDDSGDPAALAGTIDRNSKGSRIPSLTLKDAAGNRLDLEKVKGPVLVNLWATWCAPCVVELPMLDRLAGEQVGKLTVLAVSEDLSGTDKVAGFLEAKGGKNLKPWLDPENTLSDHFGTGTLPTTVMYGADGRERWRVVGGLDWSSPQARALIAEGLSG